MTDNPGIGIVGVHLGAEVLEEAEHFYTCAACGQAVDCRDLGQVFHHEAAEHERITEQ